jgi:hypothetical protein
MSGSNIDALSALLRIGKPSKPRVFISYHHGNDKHWYDQFSMIFGDAYDIFTDRSVDREIDSNNTDYVMRVIRGDFMTGTAMTIVLCGRDTWKRKYVDWEIKATLDKRHALLGIGLPDAAGAPVPDRLRDNLLTGYACLYEWPKTQSLLGLCMLVARENAKSTSRIKNWREMMSRNSS